MGVAIINSTVGLLFKDRSKTASKLENTLQNLVLFITDNAKSPNDLVYWKGARGSSLSLNDFLDYIVQPYVAISLIMEDLKVTEIEAEETRITSRKYGLHFNFKTDDDRVDKITMDYVTSATKVL
jgi:RTC4-like protein